MVKIIADNKIPFLKGILEPFANVEYLKGNEITTSRIKDANALITRSRTMCNASLLKGTNVEFIVSATIGYDHIDTEYCEKNNITWGNAPGCNAHSVLQYFAATLAYLSKKSIIDINDLVVGIVGVGHIGGLVENLCMDLGIPYLLNDPPRARNEGNQKFVELEEVCQKANLITLHVPLVKSGIDKTTGLCNNSFFESLQRKPVIVNTSRGEVARNQDLLYAFEHNKIQEVVLDVWEDEPHISSELLEQAIISTPHIAGYSADGKANATAVCVNALAKYFHLPIEEWYPNDMPGTQSNINIDCTSKSLPEILEEIFLRAYDIEEDSNRLKRSPEKFEYQRDNYPVRRDLNKQTIFLQNVGKEYVENLLNLNIGLEII